MLENEKRLNSLDLQISCVYASIFTYIVLIAATLVVATFSLAPILASALDDYFTLEKAKVGVDEDAIDAKLKTHSMIPQDGKSAFGYGILTDAGNDGVILSTTHAGVLDSEMQTNANDPVWHNHFVKLGKNVSGYCGNDAEVVDLTTESPGDLHVQKDSIILDNIPFSFDGTSALTRHSDISSGEVPKRVVSFKMDPKFDGGVLKAVCITNITAAENVSIERDD